MGKGGLTGKMRQKLTSAARCAIKMRSQEVNSYEAIKSFRQIYRMGHTTALEYVLYCYTMASIMRDAGGSVAAQLTAILVKN